MSEKTKFKKMKINYYFSNINPLIAFSFSLMFVSFISLYTITSPSNFYFTKNFLLKDSDNKKDEIIAVVSGKNITLNEFKENFEPVINQEISSGTDFKSDNGKIQYFEIRKHVFDDIVLKKILLTEADNQKIEFTSNDVDKEIEKVKTVNFKNNEDAFQKAMKKNNFTIEKLKEVIKEKSLISKVLDSIIDKNVKLTDKDLVDFYSSNKTKLFVRPEQVEASHILVKEKADAEMIIAELNIGANFEALAKKYSKDPGSKDNGGSLGFFGKSMMVKEFEDAAWSLKDGEFTLSPVKSQFGFHIIKRTNSKPSEVVSFDEAKERIAINLKDIKKREFFDKWKEKTLKESNIKFNSGYENFVSRDNEYLQILKNSK